MNTIYKVILVMVFLLIGSHLLGISQITNAEANILEPKIIEYKTFPYEIKDRWVCIPKGEKELTVEVIAKNTKEMLFYLTPTGTGTASKKFLIGKTNGKNDVFTIKHKFKKDESILYHLSVDAFNKEGYRVSGILFNISRCG
ncbi:hypothetical protein ACFFHH_13040 [Cytobacillus solani]|uniref:hypothetical protein n=1 Tax=Cytobacillus solani TaxID=1637975 RepID=UPI0011518FFD|nr:hypothetical protein [Cytobacillus solani]